MKSKTKPTRGRPKTDAPRQSVTIRLKPDQIERLDAMAAAEDVDRTDIIRRAIAQFLKKSL
jgi:predicted transcriptional regulator